MVPLPPSPPTSPRRPETVEQVQGRRFMARAFREWDNFNYLFLAVGLAAFALVWAVVVKQIAFEQRETIADVKKDNASLARALEEHTVMTLVGVDQALHFLMYQ